MKTEWNTEISRSKSFVDLQFVPRAEDTSSMSKRASHNRLRDLYNSSPSKKNVCLSQAKYNPHNWSLEAVEDVFWVTKKFHIKIIRIRKLGSQFSLFLLLFGDDWTVHDSLNSWPEKKDNILLAAETSRFYSVKLEGSLGDVGEFGTCSGWIVGQVSVTRKLSTPIEKQEKIDKINPEQIQELEIR